MGKKMRVQKRGKGGPAYRVISHKFVTELKYKKVQETQEMNIQEKF